MLSAWAQPAVPNGGFELWDTTWMPARPAGYTYYTRRDLPVVVPDTHALFGNYCARLQSLLSDTGLHGNVFNGRIINAHQPIPDLWGGSPYTNTLPPDSFIFYYKYTYSQQDTAEIYMVMKKFGAPIDPYGNGVRSFLITDSSSQWQRFSVPIGYLTRTPDTVFIALLSTTRYHPKTGSTFWVDSMHFNSHTIDNGGFETWDAPIGRIDPTGWTTNNELTMIDYFPAPAAAPTATASAGNAALKLVSELYDFDDTTYGEAVLEHTYSAAISPKPNYLLFDYMSWIDSPQRAAVQVQLGEIINDSFLVYGAGMKYLSPHTGGFKTDTVLINYAVPHDVITIRIRIGVHSEMEAGDSLIIDNLRFHAVTTGMPAPSATPPLVFSRGRRIAIDGNSGPYDVTVWDLHGRPAASWKAVQAPTQLNMPTAAKGVYLYRLKNQRHTWHGRLWIRP